MSLRIVLQKFAEGFSVNGIFLQTPQEVFPIIQQRADSLLVLKRYPDLQAGVSEVKIDDRKVGALVDFLNDQTKIVILTAPKNIQEVASHWKRFLPVVKKQINIEEFIRQEGIETKLVNRLEDIRIALSNTTTILKEKINFDSKL
ncbi:MAG: hypothetical protein ACFFB5_02300 [Promethearchaeota archaeon]